MRLRIISIRLEKQHPLICFCISFTEGVSEFSTPSGASHRLFSCLFILSTGRKKSQVSSKAE